MDSISVASKIPEVMVEILEDIPMQTKAASHEPQLQKPANSPLLDNSILRKRRRTNDENLET